MGLHVKVEKRFTIRNKYIVRESSITKVVISMIRIWTFENCRDVSCDSLLSEKFLIKSNVKTDYFSFFLIFQYTSIFFVKTIHLRKL